MTPGLTRADVMAQQTTLATAVGLLFADIGFAAIEVSLRNERLEWLYLGHAAISATVALVLWRRPNLSARATLGGFVTLALPLLPLFWMIQARSIAEGALWQPFVGRKMLILGLALLTPMLPAAPLALLAIFMIEWIVFWSRYELWRSHVVHAAGEPWVTALYFGAAYFLVALRWRNERLSAQLCEAAAAARALRQVTHVSTAVRNQVNTPLQALELGLGLLRERHPEEGALLDRMNRALEKLEVLSRALGETDAEGHVRSLREAGAELDRLEVGPRRVPV